MAKMTSLDPSLRLWQLISPAFPIGAFAYSSGLEAAIELGWVKDEATTQNWIMGQLTNSFAYLDVPIFFRLYEGFQTKNYDQLNKWNAMLLASRETAELKQEDTKLGASLLKILTDLEQASPQEVTPPLSYAASFAYGSTIWQINKEQAAMGLIWSWSENQVTAAIKLIPLGQTAGQQILSTVLKIIPDVINKANHLDETEIGASLPGLAMASAAHETQYSRLFRS